MAVTGCYARRMFGFIELNLCQRSRWRRSSPVTSNASHFLSISCPISPLFAYSGRRRAAKLCAVIHGRVRTKFMSADFPDAVPWRILKCNGCRGRQHGALGHLLSAWLMGQGFLSMLRSGRHPPAVRSRCARSYFTILISRVTTPAPMGAIFRNEGGTITPVLPWMEEGTQGVSPSFKEEVAWGPGWFPLPA
jgi:hypothetical protein